MSYLVLFDALELTDVETLVLTDLDTEVKVDGLVLALE